MNNTQQLPHRRKTFRKVVFVWAPIVLIAWFFWPVSIDDCLSKPEQFSRIEVVTYTSGVQWPFEIPLSTYVTAAKGSKPTTLPFQGVEQVDVVFSRPWRSSSHVYAQLDTRDSWNVYLYLSDDSDGDYVDGFLLRLPRSVLPTE